MNRAKWFIALIAPLGLWFTSVTHPAIVDALRNDPDWNVQFIPTEYERYFWIGQHLVEVALISLFGLAVYFLLEGKNGPVAILGRLLALTAVTLEGSLTAGIHGVVEGMLAVSITQHPEFSVQEIAAIKTAFEGASLSWWAITLEMSAALLFGLALGCVCYFYWEKLRLYPGWALLFAGTAAWEKFHTHNTLVGDPAMLILAVGFLWLWKFWEDPLDKKEVNGHAD